MQACWLHVSVLDSNLLKSGMVHLRIVMTRYIVLIATYNSVPKEGTVVMKVEHLQQIIP